MRLRITIIIVVALLPLATMAQHNHVSLSAGLMQLLHEDSTSPVARLGGSSHHIQSRAPRVHLLMKVAADIDESALKQSGAIVGTRAGNIWTVRIPREKVRQLTEIRGIEYLELGQRVALQMDSARYYANVDSVANGIGLPMPLSGKGVVVGIIDGGFDFTHPAFYDTSYSKLRIAKAWVQNIEGTPPTGYDYGAEFSDTAALLQRRYDFDNAGSHGSQCAGIAAGSGVGSKSAAAGRGVAPESELVFVSVPYTYLDWRDVSTPTIIDGINYVFSYAQSVGKPAVVNISMGSQIGARDGGSLFAQACDNLAGPGRIIVMSAMNNGNSKVHIGKEFTTTDTALHTLVPLEVYNGGDRRNYIDAWGDSLHSFCLQFGMYSRGSVINTTATYCMNDATQQFFMIGSDGDTCFVTLTTKSRDYNGKPHATIDIASNSKDTLYLSAYSAGGSLHMWQEYFDESWVTIWGDFVGNESGASDGDDRYTIGEMACAKSVITVGASVSRVYWRSLQNNTYWNPTNNQRGMLAHYSSKGPTLDNRMKPEIVAPGGMIVSPANSYDSDAQPGGGSAPFLVSRYASSKNGRMYYYSAGQGTSFASPMVAGVVALMLQVNPNLTPEAIKFVLQRTASLDTFTTHAPDSSLWGAGKVNAYAAIKQTIVTSGTVDVPNNPESIVLYPNPSKETFSVEYTSESAGHVLIEVLNAAGQLVATEPWLLVPGKNTKPIALSGVSSGWYVVVVTGKGGHVVKNVFKN